MEELEMPIYSNTCGKLFADRIVFASPRKETVYFPDSLKTITFTKRVASGSLCLMLLPSALFTLPLFMADPTILIKSLLLLLCLGLAVVSYVKARRRYAIHIYSKEGYTSVIRVWADNKKDAENFVNKAREQFFTS